METTAGDTFHHPAVRDDPYGEYLDVSAQAVQVRIVYPVLLDPAVAVAIADRTDGQTHPNGAPDSLLFLLALFRWVSDRCRRQTRLQFALGRRETRLPMVAQFCQTPERGYFWIIALNSTSPVKP